MIQPLQNVVCFPTMVIAGTDQSSENYQFSRMKLLSRRLQLQARQILAIRFFVDHQNLQMSC